MIIQAMKLLKKFKQKNFHHLIRKSNRDLSKSCILGLKKQGMKILLLWTVIYNNDNIDNPDIVVGTRICLKKKT